MINELFSFQRQAVNDLRRYSAVALNNYRELGVPQVVSLQAPTGSGKTIIMASLMEEIFFGSERFREQPEAIFIWLSDSPDLNKQSQQKLEQKADKIRLDQYVVLSDETFDQEILDDGHIYFLNTQKLSKTGNLGQHSDSRQYTIWETLEKTAKEKPDRLYFIIDEAHRGAQGAEAGKANTIMQRFIKGSKEHNLSPIPVVIGMSATAERFNKLVGNTISTLHRVVVSPDQVRSSGLLKERIFITYPEDVSKLNDMAVLKAAAVEWKNKCLHWYQYTYEQHYTNVNPVFVVQVLAGTGGKISDTKLDEVIASIEESTGEKFKQNEVVHTFGNGAGTITMNGLDVPHIEASEIADDRRIKVVLFKENLSTGWDCPRAETMMSFRRAQDATYIAQLLGRMIRTPLQCHIMVDEYLNDVRLYLPYFNRDTVKNVIDELQNAEGGDIPVDVTDETIDDPDYDSWSVHVKNQSESKHISAMKGADQQKPDKKEPEQEDSGLINIFEPEETPYSREERRMKESMQERPVGGGTDKDDGRNIPVNVQEHHAGRLDREGVIKFINQQGLLTYMVKGVRINSYLKSMLSLAGLLTRENIYLNANDEIKDEVTDLMRSYIEELHKNGKYNKLAKQVMEFKLGVQVFDVFGGNIKDYAGTDMFATVETDLDRQLRAADTKLGAYGFPYAYGRRFLDLKNPDAFKIDAILFAADEDCVNKLNMYAEKKFHSLNDKYRRAIVLKSEKCKKQYSDIIADGDRVSEHNYSLPEIINTKIEPDGDTYYDHLYANTQGESLIKLNGWEKEVLKEEQERPDFICWLRNPPRKKWSLCIPYEIAGETRAMYPDFIIIRKDSGDGYVMDILEPHNPEFKDNLGKAKGLADYTEKEKHIGRVQLIRASRDAAGKNRFKRLDFSRGTVREKVLKAMSNDDLDNIFENYGEFED